MNTIFNKHRSIIFLNGTPPDKKLILFLNTQVPIISADGAYSKMRRLQLKPMYIVGDGDSSKKNIKNSGAKIIHSADQNSTDFEKCILFAKENDLFPSLVLGISGGEFDHIMGNVQAFLKHAQDLNLYFLDTYKQVNDKKLGIKIGIPLTNNTLELELERKSVISVLPFARAVIKSSGLCWGLGDFPLTPDGILGIRNINTQQRVTFDVQEGRALLVIDISDYSYFSGKLILKS